MQDPYLYPDTNVLINKLNIRDYNKLQEMEKAIYIEKFALPIPSGNFDYAHLKAIHKHFFGDLYDWAGQERTVDIAKGNSYFGSHHFLESSLEKIFLKLSKENHLQNLSHENFLERLSHYFNEINAAHPFREGNGRTLRAFCDILTNHAGYKLDWTKADRAAYIEASIQGFDGHDLPMKNILRKICTEKVLQKQMNEPLKVAKKTKKKI